MNIQEMNLVFVDVEAAEGPTPMSGLMTEFGAVHYWTRQAFHGVLHEALPDPANPARSLLVRGGPPIAGKTVMTSFARWLGLRPILVSDNNGYDAMWIACAFDEHGIDNPFGHSSRRISDFYAGLVGDFAKTQAWKKWRVTPHSHHPVDDAMGNVEAFATMLTKLDQFQSGAYL